MEGCNGSWAEKSQVKECYLSTPENKYSSVCVCVCVWYEPGVKVALWWRTMALPQIIYPLNCISLAWDWTCCVAWPRSSVIWLWCMHSQDAIPWTSVLFNGSVKVFSMCERMVFVNYALAITNGPFVMDQYLRSRFELLTCCVMSYVRCQVL